MRLVDAKGRLLGIINLIDLLVVILVIGAALVVAWPRLSHQITIDQGQPVKVLLYVDYVKPDVAEALKVGDQISVVSGGALGRITDVKVQPLKVVTTKDDGTRVVVSDPYYKEVYITVEGKGQLGHGTAKVGGNEMLVGDVIKVHTDNFRANNANILSVEPISK
ncbi:MAG: DUF4330 domain-containing protein [Clostridia bacterium]|nr:DUF4330 domain-containing protein [Clostridia bacterium]